MVVLPGGYHDAYKMALHQELLPSYWYAALIQSLRLTYFDTRGQRVRSPSYGMRVVAHPEFCPTVVARMDSVLPKATANRVYKMAFDATRRKADALLDDFDMRSRLGKKQVDRYVNALDRFNVFAGSAATALLRRPVHVRVPVYNRLGPPTPPDTRRDVPDADELSATHNLTESKALNVDPPSSLM